MNISCLFPVTGLIAHEESSRVKANIEITSENLLVFIDEELNVFKRICNLRLFYVLRILKETIYNKINGFLKSMQRSNPYFKTEIFCNFRSQRFIHQKLNKMRKFFVIPLIIVLLAGCGDGRGRFGDAEPNSRIEDANEVEFGVPFLATIYPEGDHDWYKVDVTEPGYIRVQVSEVPDELDLQIAFALFQEWEANTEHRIRSWHDLPDALPVHEEGTYYFVMRDQWNDDASEEPFQVKVDFIEEFDSYEPNDTPENAKTVEFSDELSFAIYPLGDRDWFKVYAPGQGYLSVSARDVPGDIDLQVRFSEFDEWASPQINRLRNWGDVPDACFIPEGGEYYLEFRDNWDDSYSRTPFRVRIEYIEEMDIYEPNDHFTDAKEISRGDTLHVAIFPTGDQDYFKINIRQGSTLSFRTRDVPSALDPQMRLYVIDPDDMNSLEAYSGWEDLPAVFDVESGREYYVLLRDQWNDSSSPDLFMIRVE